MFPYVRDRGLDWEIHIEQVSPSFLERRQGPSDAHASSFGNSCGSGACDLPLLRTSPVLRLLMRVRCAMQHERETWRENGLAPPMPGTDAEKHWIEVDKAVPFEKVCSLKATSVRHSDHASFLLSLL